MPKSTEEDTSLNNFVGISHMPTRQRRNALKPNSNEADIIRSFAVSYQINELRESFEHNFELQSNADRARGIENLPRNIDITQCMSRTDCSNIETSSRRTLYPPNPPNNDKWLYGLDAVMLTVLLFFFILAHYGLTKYPYAV